MTIFPRKVITNVVENSRHVMKLFKYIPAIQVINILVWNILLVILVVIGLDLYSTQGISS